MRSPIVTACIAMVLLAPLAAAAGSEPLVLVGSRLSGDVASLEGDLAGAWSQLGASESGAPEISVTAGRIRAEVDYQEGYAVAGVVYETERGTDPYVWEDVDLRADRYSSVAEIFIIPRTSAGAAVTVGSASMDAQVHGEASAVIPKYTHSGPNRPDHVPLADSVRVRMDGSDVSVHGSFIIVAYGWVLDAAHGGGNDRLVTGYTVNGQPPADDAVDEPGPFRSAQGYLWVDDGTLTLAGFPQDTLQWAITDGSLVPAEGVLIDVAAQEVVVSGQSRGLAAGTLALQGSPLVSISPVGDDLRFDITGDDYVAELNGAEVPWLAPAPGPGPTSTVSWGLLIGAAILALAVIPFLVRRIQTQRWHARLGPLMATGQEDRVAAFASRLLGHRRFGYDAMVAIFDARFKQGRLDQAEAALSSHGDVLDEGMREFLWGRLCAARHDHAAAQEHVRRCLQVAPEMAPLVQRDIASPTAPVDSSADGYS